MNNKKFCLSDYIEDLSSCSEDLSSCSTSQVFTNWVHSSNIKIAVKELKESITKDFLYFKQQIEVEIDKIFGKKLINKTKKGDGK